MRNFIQKETKAQVFFCEFCEICKRMFCRTAASVLGSGIPELENQVKKSSYGLWRRKTELSQIVTS